MTNVHARHTGGLEAFANLALAITFLLRYTPFLASHLLFGPFLNNVHVYGPIFSEVSRLTTFAYLHSTLSRDSRQALIPPIGTLPGKRGHGQHHRRDPQKNGHPSVCQTRAGSIH
jgi:hypothetical protein